MKLKKEIATLLLTSTLLTASLTACQQAQDAGNEIDNNTTPEITTIETTPEITTIETTPQTTPETTTPEPPSTDAINFEHPIIGENITCSLFTLPEDIYKWEERSGTGVYTFVYNDDFDNHYFYVKEWDQAFKITDGTNATYVHDILVTDDYLYVLAKFDPYFMNKSYPWIKVITMKIDKSGAILESHINEFEWETRPFSSPHIDYNLYSPDQFYILYTEEGEADTATANDNWQVQVYESTDMGKTWSPKGEPFGGTDGYLQTWDFLLTRDCGYFVYIRDELTHQYDVYTTIDGGGTWQLQPFSCVDPNGEYFVKFNGIIVVNDEYVASFKAEKKLEGKGDEEEKVTFICKSTDFTEWTLTATRTDNSPSPYEEYLGNDYYVRWNFIDDQIGYTFVFYWDTEFLTFLKTTDGGKTWERQPIIDAPEPSMHLGIDDAKMFTEDTGFIKKLWHGEGRIYITTDGGKTWTGPDINIPQTDDHGYSEFTNIEYADGKYLLTVRTRVHREISFEYISQYESTDLKSWKLVQPRNTIPCNGTHSDGIHYIIHEDGNLILYIPEWHQFFIVPKRDDMYIIEDVLDSCSAVLSETEGTLFFRDFSPDDKPISLIQFTRWNTEVTIRPLNLPEGNYSYEQKYCNFIDEKTGYLFLLGGPNDIQLHHFFKTTDGGETWVEQPVETSPSIYWKEDIICAKMLDEQVGCIFGGHHANDDLSSKTYVTADGGKTWHKVGSSIELGSVEAYDFTYENGEYIIFLRTARGLGAKKIPRYLVSTDLENWKLVIHPENSINIYSTECVSSYFPSYSVYPAKVLYKYEYREDGNVFLQIDAWNQTVVLPFTYTDINWEFARAATIYGDKGIFVYHPDGLGKSIKILSFTKGSNEITEQTITWDKPINENEIFCDFIDDKNGYIFVIEEGGHPDFASGYEKVSKLYKTQDGGKTWTSIDCSNAPYTNLRECIILAKFATADIGIIAGRHWASDYSFHERTYITKDGGLTWIPVDLSNFFDSSPDKDWGIQAYDLQYVDSTYYLYVQAVHEGADKPCYLFTSSDGVEWSYLKKVD